MIYQFDSVLAARYGVEEAIFIHRIYYWVRQNRANKRNFRDGRYWTYDSLDALVSPDIFGFWNKRQIRRIVKSCCAKGLLITADYSENRMIRPTWYTVTDLVLQHYDGVLESRCDENVTSLVQNGADRCDQNDTTMCQNGHVDVTKSSQVYKEQLKDNSYKTRERARARADAPADEVTITAPAESVVVVCGELSNVLLSQDQLDKLIERWPLQIVEQEIEALSCYMASKGKKYKSHYATLLNWLRRDYPDGPPKERGNQIEDEEWIKA